MRALALWYLDTSIREFEGNIGPLNRILQVIYFGSLETFGTIENCFRNNKNEQALVAMTRSNGRHDSIGRIGD